MSSSLPSVRSLLLVASVIVGVLLLRAAVANAAPLFTTASCAVEVSGGVHLNPDLTVQYVAEGMDCATFDYAYPAFVAGAFLGAFLVGYPAGALLEAALPEEIPI